MAKLEDIELPEGDAEHTLHLHPAAKFHPNVLLPGDPARAMAIATDQLTAPRMFNHRRGLWGYSGETEAGIGFTIQSSGMGGPSAAIVVNELCDLGAELIVRVGTCGAISPLAGLGDLVVVGSAIPDDGTSQALGAVDEIEPDDQLCDLLLKSAGATGRTVHCAPVATVDLFYDPRADERYGELLELGALAIEMETAAVFAVAAQRGVRAACLLGVTDVLAAGEPRSRMEHDAIGEFGVELGSVAVAAVSAAAVSAEE